MRRAFQLYLTQTNQVVFLTSGVTILLFVVLGVVFPTRTGEAFGAIQALIVEQLGWFYILAATFFLIFVLWLFVSPYGALKLGADDDEPDYSNASWFAMLFSAGMGIGLLFFSVAEPIQHFTDPPRGEAGTVAAAQQAMNLTFFHWGLHAWAIYIVVGLSLAYFAYRHDLPLTIRSTLYPVLGHRIYGRAGDAVEILAVFGTMFGVATSLGLGVQQINAGLSYLGLIGVSPVNQLILIALITGLATVSVVSGLDVGIRRLSELNLALGLALMLFVFLVGPTVFLLSTWVESVGRYLTTLVPLTFRTDAFSGSQWQGDWTMFYWGWWISWSPFVGMFIARISRGRTIRSFIAGVLLVPTLMTLAWMIVFGNTALHMELFGEGGISEAVAESLPTALFVMLGKLPWAVITTTLATMVIATFFVTSSDSASLVVAILTSSGNPDPPMWSRIFWALLEGAVAATLLLAGGLLALRTAAIVTALPFCIVMLVMCYSVIRGLRAEQRAQPGGFPLGTTALGDDPESGPDDPALMETDWRQRLAHIVGSIPPRRQDAELESLREARTRAAVFVEETVVPALREIRRELERHGREASVEKLRFQAGVVVRREGKEEFRYAVRVRVFRQAAAVFPDLERPDTPRVLRGEIILRGGVEREYDLDTFTRRGIIEDFLHEYAKWMGW